MTPQDRVIVALASCLAAHREGTAGVVCTACAADAIHSAVSEVESRIRCKELEPLRKPLVEWRDHMLSCNAGGYWCSDCAGFKDLALAAIRQEPKP